ncbi:hypothetical protein EHQ12_03975 [Leptospira gomenensis]|uniref:Uncharacterized protein n=1 Tax=Leptospira gomenensis TaxID=2484974 RepID=A0A5F1YGW5_9LEPT|nr:hypothetical protein [Leptospira gomenensis]TGK36167.1 hypothetical protein EHQ17_04430 [Leptospira gomenensis]TGK42793.1 hypothetical protein EHQ07_14060 [Leptospira gomenensis]TGK42925.1 hypothetical protein EHQ12_03975 [Leptospira gomenensis]TGK54937.1 hypothetical protein EHQ13_18230 [Leptospira gomenensis]
MSLIVDPIPGNGGMNIFGQKDGKVGPLRAFHRVEPQPLLVPTFSTGGVTSNSLATSADLTAKLSPGDYLRLETTPRPTLIFIKEIDTTTIRMGNPDVEPDGTRADLIISVPALTTGRKWELVDMGETTEDGITIKFEEKVAPIKFAGQGESEANHFTSGVDWSIALALGELSLEKLAMIIPRAAIPTRDTEGEIEAMSFVRPIGYNFKANARRFSVVAYGEGEAISKNPRDRMDFWLLQFKFASDQKRNATSQVALTLDAMAYPDKRRTINGRPVIASINPEAVVFDVA